MTGGNISQKPDAGIKVIPTRVNNKRLSRTESGISALKCFINSPTMKSICPNKKNHIAAAERSVVIELIMPLLYKEL